MLHIEELKNSYTVDLHTIKLKKVLSFNKYFDTINPCFKNSTCTVCFTYHNIRLEILRFHFNK